MRRVTDQARPLSIAALCLAMIACSARPEGAALDNLSSDTDRARNTNAARADGGEALRVMSFNLRTSTIFDLTNTWGLRKDVLVSAVHTFSPDVLGTQECRRQQATYLRDRLDGYGFVGAGRSDGETAGEMVAIFYRKATFRCLDEGHFWLSNTPGRAGSEDWDGLFPRMVTWAQLERRATGRRLYLFNTHFSAFGDDARRKSAKLLRQKIHRIAGATPVVVTGDFNAGETSRPYDIMLEPRRPRSHRLTDTFRAVHPARQRDLGTLHGFDGRSSGERIDWILASGAFEPLSAGIKRYHDDGRYPSDHFPVTAVLRRAAPRAEASEGRVGDGRL